MELAAFLVSLNGFALLVGWHAPFGSNAMLSAVGIGISLIPWVWWANSRSPRREAALGLGGVPAVWLAVAGLFMAESTAPATPLDALRATAGLLAHVGATLERARMHEARRPVETAGHVRSSPEAPRRRHAVRIALLFLIVVPLALAVTVTPFLVEGATRFERTFAAVAGTVLGTSLLLTVLPPLVRRERAAKRTTKKRVTAAAVAVLLAALALGVELATR